MNRERKISIEDRILILISKKREYKWMEYVTPKYGTQKLKLKKRLTLPTSSIRTLTDHVDTYWFVFENKRCNQKNQAQYTID
jgi:hypothetical protein